ncbi:MAG: YtxH domain-containing protein [Planctomycetota bacterium]
MEHRNLQSRLLGASAAALFGLTLGISGCEADTSDDAADTLEDAADDVGDAIEDTADDFGDAVEDATDD